MAQPLRLPNVADFAADLTQPQRRRLGCRRDPDTGRYGVPGASTFFRALRDVDYASLDRVVLDWQHDVLGPADPHELIVLDGKPIVNAQGQVMVSAVSAPSGRVYRVEPVRPKEAEVDATAPAAATAATDTPAPAAAETIPPGGTKKENEIPAARRLLDRTALAGRLISLDARHTQHATAAQIVLANGADYLFTRQANQDGLLRTAQTHVPRVFFPCGSAVANAAHRAHGRQEPRPPRDPRVGHPAD